MRSAFRPFRVLQRQIDRAIASYESGCCNAADLRVFARSASSVRTAPLSKSFAWFCFV